MSSLILLPRASGQECHPLAFSAWESAAMKK